MSTAGKLRERSNPLESQVRRPDRARQEEEAYESFVRAPILDGIVPDSDIETSVSDVRLLRAEMPAGIVPFMPAL